jgi:PTS system cellobiose-specific IIC component
MEKFFNSKFMTKLQEIGYKLANNVFIQSLQAGLGSLLGLITVGSLFQVLAAIGNETALGWFKTGDAVYNTLTLPLFNGFYFYLGCYLLCLSLC